VNQQKTIKSAIRQFTNDLPRPDRVYKCATQQVMPKALKSGKRAIGEFRISHSRLLNQVRIPAQNLPIIPKILLICAYYLHLLP